MLNEIAEDLFPSLLSDGLFLLWRRIEPRAVNGPEMAFLRRGAALSSVSMLSGLAAARGGGVRCMCLWFIEGAGGYASMIDEISPVFLYLF